MAMQTAAQAASSALSNRSSKPSSSADHDSPMARTPLSSSATDELWMRMASRYGHAWVSQYGPMPDGIAAAEWRSTLWGLTAAQMREGFEADAIRGAEWPPSSAQFRALCMGVPSLGSVRAEIEDMVRHMGIGQPSIISRFARGVWSRMNTYAYRNSSGKTPERILRDAYELTREFVMEGGTLPMAPTAAIEHKAPKHQPASPEIAAAHLRSIAEMLKVEPVKPHTEVEQPDGDAA